MNSERHRFTAIENRNKNKGKTELRGLLGLLAGHVNKQDHNIVQPRAFNVPESSKQQFRTR